MVSRGNASHMKLSCGHSLYLMVCFEEVACAPSLCVGVRVSIQLRKRWQLKTMCLMTCTCVLLATCPHQGDWAIDLDNE